MSLPLVGVGSFSPCGRLCLGGGLSKNASSKPSTQGGRSGRQERPDVRSLWGAGDSWGHLGASPPKADCCPAQSSRLR